MELIINGESKEVTSHTVEGLLLELSLDPKKTITECNGQIIPREQYSKATLNPHDHLELVQFVGGG